jgi:kynurenine formamidase
MWAVAMRIVDLSFPIRPHFRGTLASERRSRRDRGAIARSTAVTLGCHAFTHVGAPVRCLPGDRWRHGAEAV